MHLYLTHRWTEPGLRGSNELLRYSRLLMVRIHLRALGRTWNLGGERLLYEQFEQLPEWWQGRGQSVLPGSSVQGSQIPAPSLHTR